MCEQGDEDVFHSLVRLHGEKLLRLLKRSKS